jgi:hypothetical protein
MAQNATTNHENRGIATSTGRSGVSPVQQENERETRPTMRKLKGDPSGFPRKP